MLIALTLTNGKRVVLANSHIVSILPLDNYTIIQTSTGVVFDVLENELEVVGLMVNTDFQHHSMRAQALGFHGTDDLEEILEEMVEDEGEDPPDFDGQPRWGPDWFEPGDN